MPPPRGTDAAMLSRQASPRLRRRCPLRDGAALGMRACITPSLFANPRQLAELGRYRYRPSALCAARVRSEEEPGDVRLGCHVISHCGGPPWPMLVTVRVLRRRARCELAATLGAPPPPPRSVASTFPALLCAATCGSAASPPSSRQRMRRNIASVDSGIQRRDMPSALRYGLRQVVGSDSPPTATTMSGSIGCLLLQPVRASPFRRCSRAGCAQAVRPIGLGRCLSLQDVPTTASVTSPCP